MNYYSVKKVEIWTEQTSDYGMMCEDDVRLVTKGYRLNEEFSTSRSKVYDRKNGKYMIFVDEIR